MECFQIFGELIVGGFVKFSICMSRVILREKNVLKRQKTNIEFEKIVVILEEASKKSAGLSKRKSMTTEEFFEKCHFQQCDLLGSFGLWAKAFRRLEKIFIVIFRKFILCVRRNIVRKKKV